MSLIRPCELFGSRLTLNRSLVLCLAPLVWATVQGCSSTGVGRASGGNCFEGEQSCSGECTDLASDPLNCGSCGVMCSAGACVNGSCECPPGAAQCSTGTGGSGGSGGGNTGGTASGTGGTSSTASGWCRPVFSSGVNLAWFNFANDVPAPNTAGFNSVFANLSPAGGRVLRWWFHTNGAVTPGYDGSGNPLAVQQSHIDGLKAILDSAEAAGVSPSRCHAGRGTRAGLLG